MSVSFIRIGHLSWLSFLALILAGCGGGGGGSVGDGGFTNPADTLNISIRTTSGNNEISWNPLLDPFAFDVRQPFTESVIIEVRDEEGQFEPVDITVDIIDSTGSASLFTPIPPGGDIEDAGPFSRAVLEETDGIAEVFVHATNRPGQITLVAVAFDAASGQSQSAELTITIVGEVLPVTSLTFTGPFVNAVRAGAAFTAIEPGGAIFQDGSYQRVVSVITSDENGNPPLVATPIDFFVVDAPLVGFPNSPGSFAIAGPDGNPEEGGVVFSVPAGTGGFLGSVINDAIVRPLNDRLILDGRQEQNPGRAPLPNNNIFTGTWRVETVLSGDTLTIDRRVSPLFSLNPADANTGFTVPYIVGRAQHATILRTGFTDDTGVASTFLTYPAFRIGQTAILVGCTRSQDINDDGDLGDAGEARICTILNTCNADGTSCGSVFLPVSDGTNITLTTSATELGPNTSTDVQLCLLDINFTPLQGTAIRYDIPAGLGTAVVTVNGDAGDGTVLTGGDGCATVTIASTGQQPGTDPIIITFDADGVAEPVEITISGPGAGNINLTADCDLGETLDYSLFLRCSNPDGSPLDTNNGDVIPGDCPRNGAITDLSGLPNAPPATIACSITILVTDDRGGAIPDVRVTHETTGVTLTSFSYDPAFGQFGITNADGEVIFDVEYITDPVDPDTVEGMITFSTGTATIDFTVPQPEFGPTTTPTMP